MASRRTTSFLVLLLGGSGVLHILRPGPFVRMVPRFLPAPKALVYISGAAELVAAGAMVKPETRRVGGLLAAAVLVGVFPANVSMAWDSGNRPIWYRILLWSRLPLQIPLVQWALKAAEPLAGH